VNTLAWIQKTLSTDNRKHRRRKSKRERERERVRGGERERESEKDGLLTASGKKSTGGVSFPSFIAHRPTVPY
jgi:hypothetical protein